MTKTLNQIICFPTPKSEYLFQQHWESEYFFRKNHACIVTNNVSSSQFVNLLCLITVI